MDIILYCKQEYKELLLWDNIPGYLKLITLEKLYHIKTLLRSTNKSLLKEINSNMDLIKTIKY